MVSTIFASDPSRFLLPIGRDSQSFESIAEKIQNALQNTLGQGAFQLRQSRGLNRKMELKITIDPKAQESSALSVVLKALAELYQKEIPSNCIQSFASSHEDEFARGAFPGIFGPDGSSLEISFVKRRSAESLWKELSSTPFERPEHRALLLLLIHRLKEEKQGIADALERVLPFVQGQAVFSLLRAVLSFLSDPQLYRKEARVQCQLGGESFLIEPLEISELFPDLAGEISKETPESLEPLFDLVEILLPLMSVADQRTKFFCGSVQKVVEAYAGRLERIPRSLWRKWERMIDQGLEAKDPWRGLLKALWKDFPDKPFQEMRSFSRSLFERAYPDPLALIEEGQDVCLEQAQWFGRWTKRCAWKGSFHDPQGFEAFLEKGLYERSLTLLHYQAFLQNASLWQAGVKKLLSAGPVFQERYQELVEEVLLQETDPKVQVKILLQVHSLLGFKRIKESLSQWLESLLPSALKALKEKKFYQEFIANVKDCAQQEESLEDLCVFLKNVSPFIDNPLFAIDVLKKRLSEWRGSRQETEEFTDVLLSRFPDLVPEFVRQSRGEPYEKLFLTAFSQKKMDLKTQRQCFLSQKERLNKEKLPEKREEEIALLERFIEGAHLEEKISLCEQCIADRRSSPNAYAPLLRKVLEISDFQALISQKKKMRLKELEEWTDALLEGGLLTDERAEVLISLFLDPSFSEVRITPSVSSVVSQTSPQSQQRYIAKVLKTVEKQIEKKATLHQGCTLLFDLIGVDPLLFELSEHRLVLGKILMHCLKNWIFLNAEQKQIFSKYVKDYFLEKATFEEQAEFFFVCTESEGPTGDQIETALQQIFSSEERSAGVFHHLRLQRDWTEERLKKGLQLLDLVGNETNQLLYGSFALEMWPGSIFEIPEGCFASWSSSDPLRFEQRALEEMAQIKSMENGEKKREKQEKVFSVWIKHPEVASPEKYPQLSKAFVQGFFEYVRQPKVNPERIRAGNSLLAEIQKDDPVFFEQVLGQDWFPLFVLTGGFPLSQKEQAVERLLKASDELLEKIFEKSKLWPTASSLNWMRVLIEGAISTQPVDERAFRVLEKQFRCLGQMSPFEGESLEGFIKLVFDLCAYLKAHRESLPSGASRCSFALIQCIFHQTGWEDKDDVIFDLIQNFHSFRLKNAEGFEGLKDVSFDWKAYLQFIQKIVEDETLCLGEFLQDQGLFLGTGPFSRLVRACDDPKLAPCKIRSDIKEAFEQLSPPSSIPRASEELSWAEDCIRLRVLTASSLEELQKDLEEYDQLIQRYDGLRRFYLSIDLGHLLKGPVLEKCLAFLGAKNPSEFQKKLIVQLLKRLEKQLSSIQTDEDYSVFHSFVHEMTREMLLQDISHFFFEVSPFLQHLLKILSKKQPNYLKEHYFPMREQLWIELEQKRAARAEKTLSYGMKTLGDALLCLRLSQEIQHPVEQEEFLKKGEEKIDALDAMLDQYSGSLDTLLLFRSMIEREKSLSNQKLSLIFQKIEDAAHCIERS